MTLETSKYRFLSASELMHLPDPEWLIGSAKPGQALIMKDSLSIVYGPPGAGKTFMALDWALSIATGTEWFGLPASKGKVLYIYAEGAYGLKLRVKAWGLNKGKSSDELDDIVFYPDSLVLKEESTSREFAAAFLREKKWVPDLVVLDTVSRCFGGNDENGSADMSFFIRRIDDLRKFFNNCAALLVHHSNKAEKTSIRGSSALPGAADSMFNMKPNGGLLQLTCTKQKDAQPFKSRSFKLYELPCGNEMTSCVLDDWSIAEPANDNSLNPSKDSTHELALFTLAAAGDIGLKHKDWKLRCMEDEHLSKSQFNKALRKLRDSGYVEKIGPENKWRATKKGHDQILS